MKPQTGIRRPGKLLFSRCALLLSALFLSAPAAAFQQPPVTIKGHVSEKGAASLPGVTITLKGSSTGTTTDEKGNFSISLPNDAGTLLFSYVGYLPKEIPVKGKTTINIVLEQDATGLGEVVVVGYGTQKKVNLTGAVEQISSARLTDRPVTQLSTALQGIAPGVTVTTTTGAPGADAGTIRIRGIGTLNNANPLILIDGVEGNMNEIDPNLIESVSVLKDAASSAIYGSRAANGVVLVTTKRAKSDQLSVSYNGYVGWQSPTNLPDKVDAIDHMRLLNVAYKNTGLTPLYSDAQIEEYRQKMITDPDNFPNTDWQKEVLTGSGVMQNHYVGISGSSGKLRFMTSLGYLNQDGIIKTSGFERYTLRNNADVRFNDKLSMKLDLQLINRTTTEPGRGMTNVFLQMNRIPAVQPGRFLNGQYGEGWNGNNPIAMVEDGGRLRNNTLSLFGNLQLSYQPTQWLTAEVMAAPRFNNSYDNNFVKAVPTYTAAGNIAYTQPAKSELTNGTDRGFYGNYRASLTAHKAFRRHETKLLLGASRETFSGNGFTAFRDNFQFPQYPVQDAGSRENMQTTGTASEWALQSFFGRLNYSYHQRYLFEANARYDGSSRFLSSRRYGFFPSFSAGWRLSEEDFMQFIKPVVNDLKLRGSWGKLGNQNIGTYPFASNLAMGAYSMGGEVVSIAALNDMGNEEITWETTTMTNFGVDVALFRNLTITADWYRKVTSDILLKLNIPLSIGLNAPYQNAGKVLNQGWELGLNYSSNIGDFNYGINASIADVHNEVLDLRGINSTDLLISREGYSINSIYALEANGYFQSQAEIDGAAKQIGILAPGDIRYVNQNKDAAITNEDYKVIGSTIPRYTYSFNLNASFRNFSLNAFFQGVGKADGYLYSYSVQPFYSGGTAHEQHKDYWREDNREAKFPRLTYGDNGNNYQPSSFWMKSAAYLRLKNLQIAYALPQSVTGRLKLKSARVYAAGQNILTWDNFWDGYDVEAPVGTGNRYPQVKVYTIGLDVKF